MIILDRLLGGIFWQRHLFLTLNRCALALSTNFNGLTIVGMSLQDMLWNDNVVLNEIFCFLDVERSQIYEDEDTSCIKGEDDSCFLDVRNIN